MEQGTGKTVVSGEILKVRIRNNQVKKVLIVSPLDCVLDWRKFLKGLLGNTLSFKEDSKDKVIVKVVNYDKFRAASQTKALVKWKPDFVIVDESQRIKNRKSTQSKALHKIGDVSKYRLILSGTPIDSCGLEIWSQYRFLCPEVFGKKWTEFANRYARNTGYGYTKWVIRKKYEKELIEKIREKCYSVDKGVLNLPKAKHRISRVDLEEKARTIYSHLELDAIVHTKDSTIHGATALTKIIRLTQVTGGFVKTEEGDILQVSRAKLNRVKHLLTNKVGSQKVVIFARFIPEIEALSALCTRLNINHGMIHGKIAKKSRFFTRQRFLKTNKIPVLISQIRTGGIGVNELVAATYGILYSTGYSWIDYDQALARLHRRGQDKEVTFFHLLCRNTIDEEIYKLLKEKKKSRDLMLNFRRRVLTTEIKGRSEEIKRRVSELYEEVRKEAKTARKEVELDKPKVTPKPVSSQSRDKPNKPSGPIVTIKELAFDYEIPSKELRRILRKKAITRPGGRWEWAEDSKTLKRIHKIIKKYKKAKGKDDD